MVEIQLIPHVGIDIENIGQVKFGQTPDEVEKVLGAPTVMYLSYRYNGLTLFYNPAYKEYVRDGAVFTDNMKYNYDNYEMTVSFNAGQKVEFIECKAGPFSDKTKTVIYDADFFSLSADEAIELLDKKNNGSVFYDTPHRPKLSCCYLEIDVGIWREMDEADAEESIREAIATGTYEINRELYENKMWKAKASHFQSIGIGEKGYFPYHRR